MRTDQLLPLLPEMAVLVRVVDCGSFSEAARQLGMTPSATSRSVTRLEKALATRLLHRTTRKLRLSEEGVAVYRHCLDMLNSARAAVEAGGQFNPQPEGVLRISVPKAVGRVVIHPLMPAFLARYPAIDIQMALNDAVMDLIDDQVDIAIRITDRPPPGLKGRRLMDIDHLLCATPRYLAEHGVPQHPRDLAAHSCLCLGEDPGDALWSFRQGAQTSRVRVRGRYAANHTEVRLDAVRHHLGIGSLPWFTARQALANGDVVQVLPGWTFTTRYTGGAWLLYHPARFLPPKIRVFIDYLSEALSREYPSRQNSPPEAR
ncbi:transcriptional regulator [Chimaeribacter arupi]|uniref:LysR family transcriptional regulator n=1 Tax=Chimaeribacter arupi TaxID=2060066 RepID=UPI000C7AA5F7|nr:LysR family transcriptional regulator [Chimaeribacter arupi]MDV5139877.1 LysR family transcriptional regulator [Chimaeribacter arupi]PLR30484.1 transcriptional regulator [Chimaeribacter arupi]PLR46920.1 transcriptional regulator [Chimaeribacter arupi]